MTRSVGTSPQHIPITRDAFKPEDYASVPGKVAETNSHSPEKLEQVWRQVAADGFVSRDEGRKVERAVVANSFLLDRGFAPNTVEAKFIATKLADPSVKLDPGVRARFESVLAERETRMDRGTVLTGTFKHADKLHTLTEGVIDLPFEEFVKKMPPDRWGPNLAEYRGGEVKVTARDAQGRVTEQRERMVTETPLSKYLRPLFGNYANDMTKVEKIVYDDKNRTVAVKWEVLASDNKTTLIDMGELRFSARGGKTKAEFESEHRIDTFPGTLETIEKIPVLNRVVQGATETVMRDFFAACVKRYQDVATGAEPVR
ncbi:MAG: hypothetical protein HY904_19850 [Deltaproteobacteria bacterium]|nr:hypothetical protein [Deltaproteobacteria bacterium]